MMLIISFTEVLCGISSDLLYMGRGEVTFEFGDVEDTKLCTLITHEFLRAETSFHTFIIVVSHWQIHKRSIQNEKKEIALTAYYSYADFISHLCAFYEGCFKRDRQSTGKINSNNMKHHIRRETEKYQKNMLLHIDQGLGDRYGLNDRTYYEEDVPDGFAEKFIKIRNMNSHPDTRRFKPDSMLDFYQNYHKFIIFLFNSAKDGWSVKSYEEIDLKEIENFLDGMTN